MGRRRVEGGAPPVLLQSGSASRALPQNDLQSENVNLAPASSTSTSLNPLPVSKMIVESPNFSQAAVSKIHRSGVKSNELRADSTCMDTSDWKDKWGYGCDDYEAWYDEAWCEAGCPGTDGLAGDMGPVTKHCCICGGGHTHTFPPTNSPTKSAAPLSSPSSTPSTSTSSTGHTHHNNESTLPDITSPLPVVASPVEASSSCLDTPDWKDNDGEGCDWYEEEGWVGIRCPNAGWWTGNMGPASEHCCICGGGNQTIPTVSQKHSLIEN